MNITSMRYFAELTKDLNVTKTAERLFISQQTLSNHIKRLEEHYGLELFYRKPRLQLTTAGEVFLEYAIRICQEEHNLTDLLDDLKKEERGTILFGASSLRLSCLPTIMEVFSNRYPNVELRITAANTERLQREMLQGNLDVFLAFEPVKYEDIYYRKVLNDDVFVCMTDELLQKYYGNDWERKKKILSKGVRLHEIAKVPFCILDNKLGKAIQKCFNDEKVVPKIYTTSSQIRVTTSLAHRSLSTSFATRVSLIGQSAETKTHLNLFPLLYKGEPLQQEIYIGQRTDRYLTRYKQFFLKLLEAYFIDLEHKTESELLAEND